MWHRASIVGPALSDGVTRSIAAACALVYVVIYVKASALLPEFIFRDAEKIQAQMSGAQTYAGTSFDAIGKIYTSLGPALDVSVAGTGVCFIWAMLRRAKRLSLLAAAMLLSAPCVLFNLFVPTKDTLVVLMSLVLVRTMRGSGPGRMALFALVLYAVYAGFIRSYFALVIAVAFGAFLYLNLPRSGRIVVTGAAALLIFSLPSSVYVALLSPRDAAVDYLVYQSQHHVRTSFYNPFDPSTFIGFVADYFYAVGRLNFPLFFSLGVKEFVLQLFAVLAVWPAVGAICKKRPRVAVPPHAMLACLLIGHVSVSMLFEPDLGSYARHLSSVALFSMVLLIDRANSQQPVRARSSEVVAERT
jgi:hypothetical protein